MKTPTGKQRHRSRIASESIFLQAVSFHQGQKILMERVSDDRHSVRAKVLAPPVCVLAAFTSELLLKCLILEPIETLCHPARLNSPQSDIVLAAWVLLTLAEIARNAMREETDAIAD